jgi:hypothetical protein
MVVQYPYQTLGGLLMRETITVNRIILCAFTGNEVAQQISAYFLTGQGPENAGEILTKYCSGQYACKSVDCQFVVGITGKNYTKALENIYTYSDK